jgi:hypothetical protein
MMVGLVIKIYLENYTIIGFNKKITLFGSNCSILNLLIAPFEETKEFRT